MKWALKAIDMDNIYYADEQYGPPGSLTVSSKEGSSMYHPRTFPTEKQAKDFLKRLVEQRKAPRDMKWEVVQI